MLRVLRCVSPFASSPGVLTITASTASSDTGCGTSRVAARRTTRQPPYLEPHASLGHRRLSWAQAACDALSVTPATASTTGARNATARIGVRTLRQAHQLRPLAVGDHALGSRHLRFSSQILRSLDRYRCGAIGSGAVQAAGAGLSPEVQTLEARTGARTGFEVRLRVISSFAEATFKASMRWIFKDER
jgi:hypothetical protein